MVDGAAMSHMMRTRDVRTTYVKNYLRLATSDKLDRVLLWKFGAVDVYGAEKRF